MPNNSRFNNPFILIGIVAGIVAILDYIGVVSFPIGFFSVSAFYIGSAFFTAFAIWFKWKGLLAIYLGLLVGAVLAGTFTIFAFILALGNVFGVAIPLIAFRYMKFNPELKSLKDYFGFIIFATILQNMISAAYTLGGFVFFGIMPKDAFILAATGWIVGGIIVSIVLGIPLLKFITPIIKRTSLYE